MPPPLSCSRRTKVAQQQYGVALQMANGTGLSCQNNVAIIRPKKQGAKTVPNPTASAPIRTSLSAPKSHDSLRLRRRFLPLPRRIARFLRPQDARFPLRRKSLANGDFCQGERRSHLDQVSSACGWPIWLKGQSAKGLASTVSKYTSVELALHP